MKTPKRTSLETSDNVVETLNWKLKVIQEGNGLAETAIADYIALAIDNLARETEYIKGIQQDYKNNINEIASQIETIKVQGAKFFDRVGIVKIEGVFCSSITLTKEKLSLETESTKKVFTPFISQAEIEELLIGLGKAEMKDVVTSNVSKYIPAKLRVNPKKKAVA